MIGKDKDGENKSGTQIHHTLHSPVFDCFAHSSLSARNAYSWIADLTEVLNVSLLIDWIFFSSISMEYKAAD